MSAGFWAREEQPGEINRALWLDTHGTADLEQQGV